MAAIYFKPTPTARTVFKSGFAVNNSIYIPFLSNLVGPGGSLIVTEVTLQHNDSVQYFLTFDDFINYYYFGKALGSISITGMLFSDCSGDFRSLNTLMARLASIRGTTQKISFGNTTFTGVMSTFTLKASSDASSIQALDFMVQLSVIDNSMPPAQFTSAC